MTDETTITEPATEPVTEPATHNEAAGPSALPHGGHYPAGFVSPSHDDAAQRSAMRTLILQEREEAARAELEAEVTKRLNAARGVQEKPEAAPAKPTFAVVSGAAAE